MSILCLNHIFVFKPFPRSNTFLFSFLLLTGSSKLKMDGNRLSVDENDISGTSSATPHLVISEILSKLVNVRNHLQDTEHDCEQPCYGVNNLQWCISKIQEFNISQISKELQTKTLDVYIEKCLGEFGEADTVHFDIANYLSTRYRSSTCTPFNDSRRISIRELGRYPTDTNDADDVISFLSVGKEPQVSLDWLMDSVDEWSCDVFRIGEVTTKPLTSVTYTLLKKRNLFETLQIPSDLLVQYINEIEIRYHEMNPYHNSLHAADVTQTMHFLLSAEPLKTLFSDLEIFALLFSSAIHDVDHPGLNNPFLIKSRDRYAILYNDAHVNENHHLAVAFQLLYRDENHFLTSLKNDDAEVFRQMVIEMVISTDMNLHVAVTSKFQVCVQKSFNKRKYLPSFEDRLEIMKGLLHFADISNPAKPLELYQQWAQRVTEEFFAQGDLEREKGMAISPLCDRNKVDLGKSQTGFIDFIVRPLLNIVNNFYSNGDDESRHVAEKLDNHLDENFNYFKNI